VVGFNMIKWLEVKTVFKYFCFLITESLKHAFITESLNCFYFLMKVTRIK